MNDSQKMQNAIKEKELLELIKNILPQCENIVKFYGWLYIIII